METFLAQLHTLLTRPPGNLAYHLVIVFAVVAGLQAAIFTRQMDQRRKVRQVRLALAGVLVWQLAAFFISALAWQGVLQAEGLLPLLDRAIITLSLLWITWVWLFPESNRMLNALVVMLTAGAIVLFYFGYIDPSPTDTFFNHTYWDLIWSYTGIGIAAVAIIGLLVRQPGGWGIGFGFFVLQAAGFIAHVLLPQPEQDYSSWIRLAQLAAYPLLPAMALRLRTEGDTVGADGEHSGTLRRLTSELRALQSWLDMSDSSPAERKNTQLLRALAYHMGADITLLVNFSLDGETLVEAGYNALTEQELPPILMRPNSLPLLSINCLRERPIRLPAGNHPEADLALMAETLNLDTTGNLLSVPLRLADGRCASLILMAPYHARRWSSEDQAILVSLSERFSQALTAVDEQPGETLQVNLAGDKNGWQAEEAPSQPEKPAEPVLPVANSEGDLYQVLTFALATMKDLLAEKDISLRLDAGSGLRLAADPQQQVEWLLWIHSALRRLADSTPAGSTLIIQAGPLESLGADHEIWLLISVQAPAGPASNGKSDFAAIVRSALQPLVDASRGRAQLKMLPGGEPALSVRIPGEAIS